MAVKIFFCYAREDEALLDQLKRHLKPLQRQGLIELWHDRAIGAGTDWKHEIDKHLTLAQIILLLISPHFMESDYCYSIEMQKAIERHKLGKAIVIPVILRPGFWQVDPISELQALPTDAKPVTGSGWHNNLDEAFYDIVKGIHRKVTELLATELLAEAEKKQQAIDSFEKQLTQACVTDDDLAIVAAYDIIQSSPYAKYYTLRRDLQNRLALAQERVIALKELREIFAHKHVLEIGSQFKRKLAVFKYLTEEEWGILTLAAVVTELYTAFSNEDLGDLEDLKNDFIKDSKADNDDLVVNDDIKDVVLFDFDTNLKTPKYSKVLKCFAIKLTYEHIQSSPYKDMLTFTEQEEQLILSAKQDIENLMEKVFESIGVGTVDIDMDIETYDIVGFVQDKAFDALYVKRVCPYCIKEFYVGDCRIVSSAIYMGRVLKGAPIGIEQLRRRVYPEPLTGAEYTQVLACRECPHCSAHLPYNIELVENITIVVLGDMISGQSTYFATLLHEIETEWIPKNKGYMHLKCLTDDVEWVLHRDLVVPLFENNHNLPATSPQNMIAPLIYELSLSASPSRPVKTVNLIFYHGTGEDYASEYRLVRFGRYVFNASGIIYIADPWAMPKIQNHLFAQDSFFKLLASASRVLSLLIHLFERQFGTEPESRLFSIPIAVTLSKSDMLKYLENPSEPYLFLQNPKNGYSDNIDLQDLKAVDGEVRKLMCENGDPMLLKLASRLNAQFFAVSATGNAPDRNGDYPAVEPRRCLDPFLWILYKLDVFHA